jgi:hypothetical protein
MAGAALATTPALVAIACGGAIESTDHGTTSSDPSTDEPTNNATSLPDAAGVRRPDGSRDAASDGPGPADADEVAPLPDGSLANGVCAHPTGHKNLFDSDCVYVVGTFAEGASQNSTFFEPAHPSDHRGGIVEYGNGHVVVRPADNRVLYGAAGVRVFSADALVAGRYPYDMAAAANDPVIDTPACPDRATLQGIFPDDSVAIYRCAFGLTYLEGSSVPLAGLNLGVDAVGPMRTALVGRPPNGPKIWSNGVDVPITGLPTGGTFIAARYAGGSRFHVALQVGTVSLQQWSVGFDGVAAFVGAYLNPLAIQSGFGSELDPAGNLYRQSWELLHDRIVRFSVVNPPAIVYDEEYPDGTKKPIRLHGGYLFTGP